MSADHYKVLFTGPVGAGKTTAIRTISDHLPMMTDVAATDETRDRKPSTTVAMDYGVIRLGRDEVVHLYGTPGQDRFDFMWEILTKGGGGAHTREKIVAEMAARFVVVVDESKLVPHLGPFGTPLEVLDFAPEVVARRVRELGASHLTTRDAPSDNGNLIVDAHFGEIADPHALAAALSAVPGIVDHGIFRAELTERVIVAGADGSIREILRAA